MANDPLRACPTCGTPVADLSLGLRDYRWISDALPGREAPMDLDFVLEKNGMFLVLEFKPEGAPLPLGQRITLRGLSKKDEFEVWIVWESRDGKHVEVGAMSKRGTVDFVEKMTHSKLLSKALAWYKEAQDYED